MYLAYSLLLTLGLIVLIPRFLIQALVNGKYLPNLRQRLGLVPQPPESHLTTIWLHCVSVGETQAARPLVRELRKSFPNHQLVVSTVTITGQALAREVFKQEAVQVIYFPFDWNWCVGRALNAIKPDLVLMMETELWPNFLRRCGKARIPVALVNGRISRKSFRGYNLVKFFVSRILNNVSMAVMQTEADAKRIRALGMDRSKIAVGGNVKFDANPTAQSSMQTQYVRERFRFQSTAPLILAASTHATEERIIVDCFTRLKQQREEQLRLAIAPRHPERFDEVANILEKSDLSWVRRSNPVSPHDTSADVVLIDTIGDLPSFYPLAAIAFVGGSLVPKGGHNVLEPAACGTAIVTGAHTDNFEAIVQLLEESDGIVRLPPLPYADLTDALCYLFDSLLTDPKRRDKLGNNAKRLVESNRGAAARTMEFITPLLQAENNGRQSRRLIATEVGNS